ncbi:MAG: ABC transporter ATP-binding protein/permease [Solobacterium sp.]|jgi:ATP-binding cassette subfamily B protein|nr:ABC transporter ATP-binding protein/permease [Solobacterium sp.]MCH4205450.1 ABC transporter ATP-binding protein/permease [Solobacterium sp.]MCH4226662.1 ABC transporter ATP-binding protein/permease [Solobacterium sp.]MCH4282137.1 ABC transporter ATP-binding protein/permease [Solobacterium sp.]
MNDDDKNIKLKWFGIPQLLPFAKKYKVRIIWMIILGIITSLIDAVYPLFNQYALNHFVLGNTLDTLGFFILAYLVILVCQVILNFLSVYWTGLIEMSVDRDLRSASFNHLQELSFAYFNQNNVGYVQARVMSDTGKIGEMVSWRMMDIVWNGSYLIFVFVNMFLINAELALYILLLVPIAVLIIALFQKKLVVLNRKIREINSRITGNFNEGITGAKSIKTLVVEDAINTDFRKDTSRMEKTSVHATGYSAAFSAAVTIMSSAALAIVLWRGGIITMEGVIMIGTLSVFMNYALNMLDPIQGIIGSISALIAIQVNIERFTKLLHTKSDVADTPEVIEKYGDTFHPKKENWEPLHGDVEFKDVSFQYPDGNEMVLQNFNLKVPQGTNVAIVGETGAGKSTLVNLVCRFFEPTEGQVLIDGRDARERSQLWLHSNIGYVLQTPHLFSGSVRDNLKYGNPDASDEEIWKALELVDAVSVVNKMEHGLDSEVGEGGDMLSTGEKQLLSFARAILADPRILVLDEATASIDTLTEKAIQDAIFTVIKGRTSFVIAHRLSTIVDADIILVVQDGRIIERGRHDELMKAHGHYYDLYTRQYEEMVTDMVN